MPLQNAPWFSARVASSYFFRISRPSRGHFEEWDQNLFFKKTTRINPRFGPPKPSKIPVQRNGCRRRLLCHVPFQKYPSLCSPCVCYSAAWPGPFRTYAWASAARPNRNAPSRCCGVRAGKRATRTTRAGTPSPTSGTASRKASRSE